MFINQQCCHFWRVYAIPAIFDMPSARKILALRQALFLALFDSKNFKGKPGYI